MAMVLLLPGSCLAVEGGIPSNARKLSEVGDGVGRESFEGIAVVQAAGSAPQICVARGLTGLKRELDVSLVHLSVAGEVLGDKLVYKTAPDGGLALGKKLRWFLALPAGGFVLGQQDDLSSVIAVGENGKVMWTKTVVDLDFRALGGREIPGETSFFLVGELMTRATTRPVEGKPVTVIDGVLAKVSAEGKVLWQKVYDHAGQTDHLLSILIAPNGELVLIGDTTTSRDKFGVGASSAWVLRCDAAGTVVSERTFAGRSPSVAPLGEKGFAIAYDADFFAKTGSRLKSLTWKLDDRWEVVTGNTAFWIDQPMLAAIPNHGAVACVIQDKEKKCVLLVYDDSGKCIQQTEVPDSAGCAFAKLACSTDTAFVTVLAFTDPHRIIQSPAKGRLYSLPLRGLGSGEQR